MEFLMTYGWAILVVLVVIGALAYFGILNPATLLPERCEVQMGLYCKDHLINTSASTPTPNKGRITLRIENGRGTDIKIAKIIANCTSASTADCSWLPKIPGTGDELILNGVTAKFSLNRSLCAIESAYKGKNTKLKWDLAIKWYYADSTSSFTHTAKGQLMAVVE